MMQLEPISLVFYNSERLLTSLTGLVFILISYPFKITCMLCPRGMTNYEENTFSEILKRTLILP